MATSRPLRFGPPATDPRNREQVEDFFDIVRFLIAHNDHEFVGSLEDSARGRVQWILEREADTRKRKDVKR